MFERFFGRKQAINPADLAEEADPERDIDEIPTPEAAAGKVEPTSAEAGDDDEDLREAA